MSSNIGTAQIGQMDSNSQMENLTAEQLKNMTPEQIETMKKKYATQAAPGPVIPESMPPLEATKKQDGAAKKSD